MSIPKQAPGCPHPSSYEVGSLLGVFGCFSELNTASWVHSFKGIKAFGSPGSLQSLCTSLLFCTSD